MILPTSKRLAGFHLLSGIVHGLILWLVIVPLWEKQQDLPFEVRFQIEDPPKPPPIRKPRPKPPVEKKVVTPPKKPLVQQEKPVPPPVKEQPKPREPNLREEILSSPMGSSDFQVPVAPPTITTPSPEIAEMPPPRKGLPAVSKDDLDLTKLPDAQFREQQSIIVYYEADIYILFAGADKTGIPVPGTDLCIDGTFLRTVERQKLTHTVVDPEKCWTMVEGDSDRVICLGGADTTTAYFDDYLRTPIKYRVNHCLAYDDSHCYEVNSGDSDKEVCRVNFGYEGIWAAETNFAYRCTKSETRTFRNPLEYTIRYMEVPEHGGERNNRPKQFHRVVRSIPQCKK